MYYMDCIVLDRKLEMHNPLSCIKKATQVMYFYFKKFCLPWAIVNPAVTVSGAYIKHLPVPRGFIFFSGYQATLMVINSQGVA